MKNIVFIILLLGAVFGLCYVSFSGSGTSSAASTYVAIDIPGSVVNGTVQVKEASSFTASVRIFDVVNFSSAVYEVWWNPSILEFDGVLNGSISGEKIYVTNSSYNPSEGKIALVSNASQQVSGSGTISEIEFHVIGSYCNYSDVDFSTSSTLYDGILCPITANWTGKLVHVDHALNSLTVNQTSSCCNVVVTGYGTVVAGTTHTFSNITHGTVLSVAAAYHSPCNTWGNWTGGVANASAMSTTVTMDASKTITANCTYVASAQPTPTPTATALPGMNVVINAPAEVNASTGFQVWVNISNANFPPGTYCASYNITWDNNVVHFGSAYNGSIGTKVIPIGVPVEAPGELWVVQNFNTSTNVNGSGFLSDLRFIAVGNPCDTTSITFHATNRSIYNVTAGSNMTVSWTGDSVHIAGGTTNVTLPSVAVVAPAEVREDGSFFANISVYNVSLAAGNYTANYTLQYNPSVIRVVNVSSGTFANTTIPVTNWSYVPSGVQGVVNVVQNFSANATVNANGSLARFGFDVVGQHCNNGSITFNTTASGIYALPSMTKINVSWVNDSVHVFGPTPTPTATATTVVPSKYNLTVNQTSSCCNVSVASYGNVTAGNVSTFTGITSGTVIQVNASYNGTCNTWGNWSGSVGNASAMNTTVTMNGNRTITANCSYVEGAGGGVPGWVWPLVAIMSLLILAALGYLGYGLGWWTRLGAGMRGWFGGDLDEYVADGLGEEDMFDDIYGDTGPGIRPGSGGGMEIDDDLL